MKSSKKYKLVEPIVIIGGGAGGCGSARALAKAGYKKIVLLEASESLFSKTSIMTPGRSGHGFHYIDLPTGIMYQNATIDFNKEFPGFRIGEPGFPETHPLRRGRYFIVKKEKGNLFEKEEILKTFEELHKNYRNSVSLDEKNKVVGEPDDFLRVLDKKEYESKVNLELVDVGLETTEQLLDCPRFRKHLINELKSNDSIKVLTKKRVGDIAYGSKTTFIITTADGLKYEANTVINASWYNIGLLDRQLDLYDHKKVVTNRLKVIAKVKIPKGYENEHSMFFCMGAHCMFSNMGHGIGLMTYAKQTNLENFSDLAVGEKTKRLLNGGVTSEEIKTYGEEIIKGVSQYIPWMKDAELITVNFGVVRTHGDVDIFDPKSAFHSRAYSGVEPRQLGYFANACMKLLFLHQNGKIITEELENHARIVHLLKAKSKAIARKFGNKTSVQKLLFFYISKQLLPEDLLSSPEQVSLRIKQFQNASKKAGKIFLQLLTAELPIHILKIICQYYFTELHSGDKLESKVEDKQSLLSMMSIVTIKKKEDMSQSQPSGQVVQDNSRELVV